MKNDGNGYEGPKKVGVFGGITSRFPCNVEKMRDLEASTSRFSIRVDVLRKDLVEERRRLRVVMIGRHGRWASGVGGGPIAQYASQSTGIDSKTFGTSQKVVVAETEC